MRPILVLLLMAWSIQCQAKLGETVAEIHARYGAIVKTNSVSGDAVESFHFKEYEVNVIFVDGRSAVEVFKPAHGPKYFADDEAMALGQGSGTPDGWYPDILTQTDYNKLWLTKDGFVLKVSRPVSYEDKTDAVTVTTQGYLDRFSSKQAQEKADLVSSLSSPIAVPVHVATAEELKALSEAREAGRAKAEAAAVAFNQAAADRGDAYGLLRMGERYRDGEGVARDLPKARAYLAKSAAAGNSQAERELSAMKNP